MIRVTIYRRSSRGNFEAQWKDPVTGKYRTRSTGTPVRREAERFAAKLENELQSGEFREVRQLTWEAAKELYASEVFPSQSPRTSQKMRDTWHLVEKVINPGRVMAIQEPEIGDLIAHLQVLKRSPFTIRTHLSKLKVFLQWAYDRRFIVRMPSLRAQLRMVPASRGRPLAREEFERMLHAVRKVVGRERAPAWRRLLVGLWLSGLRLGEAISLHWTDDSRLCVDLTGKRPMFRIQAVGQKSRQFRLLTMTPDFYRFLSRTDQADRHGYVFRCLGERGERLSIDAVSREICAIGRKARIKVSTSARGVKYASAHDLRRSFGFRWAARVRAPVLQMLMRHASITTTMQFYVRQDAEAAAAEVWRGVTDTFTDKAHPGDSLDKPDTSENAEKSA